MKLSKLLIQEHPLQVLPTLAKSIGLTEAIILQQIHYWMNNTKTQGTIKDGQKWIYNTYENWQAENFPFWSIPTIQRAVRNLEKMGLIKSAQFDAQKRDMKKYYTIDYDQLDSLDDINLICSDDSKLISSIESNCDDVNKESETTPETTSEITREREFSQADMDASNKKVDAVLRQNQEAAEKQASGVSWPGRDKIPEPIRELLDVYVQLTGQCPTKGTLMFWMGTGNDWLEAGIIADDLRKAYQKAHPEKGEGFMVASPASLTKVAGMFAGERRQRPNTSQVDPFATLNAYKERMKQNVQTGR